MINRVFSTMIGNVGQNIQDTSSQMSSIIGRYINDAYFDLMRRTNFQIINDGYSFSTIAGKSDYVMPDNFGKELYVRDATNLKDLSFINYQDLAHKFTDTLASQDVPDKYTIIDRSVNVNPGSSSTSILTLQDGSYFELADGSYMALNIPITTSELSIVSDNVGDTTQTIFIRGLSGGLDRSETVTLSGTTEVSTQNSYEQITAITKDGTTSGVVTIKSDQHQITVAEIAPSVLTYKAKIMRLHRVPASVYTIQAPYIVKPLPMSEDQDTPLIDAADVIEQGATAYSWRFKRQLVKAQEWERVYEKSVNELIWDKENQPNQTKLFNPTPYSRDIY